MEKLSRVKKYEELRKSIETDNHVDKKEEATLHNDDTLKRFDSSVLKKAEIKEDTYQPGREKVIEEVKEETGSQVNIWTILFVKFVNIIFVKAQENVKIHKWIF